MTGNTTIQITENTRERLEKLKVHPKEPVKDVVDRILEKYEEANNERKRTAGTG